MTVTVTRFAVSLLVAGLVVTGCSAGVSGTPASRQDTTGPFTAQRAFGDPRTVDPCSLTGPFAFQEHGQAQMPAKVTMDECHVTVLVGEGGDANKVTVELGLLRHVDTLPSGQRELRALPGNAAIVEVPTQITGSCVVALRLADDIAVSATAEAELVDTVPSTTLCALARSGAEGIAEVARTNRVRHWEPPHNSLARQSACGLLPADDVASLLGITERVSLYPAEHQCRWGRSGGASATVKVDFPVGSDEGVAGVPGGTPVEELGGRPTWVSQAGTGDIDTCTLVTQHIAFAPQRGEVEFAALRVAVPTSEGKDPCAIGRQLTDYAWPRLPAGD